MLATPSQGRDRAWLDSFLAAAPSALLKIAEKRLIQGPDGFVYFHLINPVGDAEVDSAMVGAEGTFVVTTLADLAPDLYAKGIGAAIFTARHPGPAWVFSYGDIVNLQINGSFQADNGAFITPGDQPDDADGEAIAGPPPETLLPLTVRNWLRKFLEQFYQRPQVTLLIRKGQGMELLFDATPDRFPDQDTFQGALGALGWFLPRDYAYSVSNDPGYPFEPL